ncbi:hypothetical protein ACX12M_02735 [Cellulosimicrobium cellulans]
MSPRVRVSATLGAVVVALAVGACSEPEPEPSPVEVAYSDVSDETATDDGYDVNPTAVGFVDILGDWQLTLGFTITNPNGTKFDPVATVHGPDGDDVVCRVDDLRRLPSVKETTTDWDLPCDGPLPTDPEGVTITVRDDYA